MTCAGLLVCLAAAAGPAAAQSPARGRIEVGAGVDWIGQATLGTSNATETTPAGTPSTLFSTTTDLTGAAGFRAYVGVRASSAFEFEGFASRSKPTLRTVISGDLEAPAPVTATDLITQYMFGGEVLWLLPIARGSSQLVPFVSGGAAYLRQLHEGATLAVNGQAYRLGGGVKYVFPSGGGFVKGYGLRADAGVDMRVKGVAFDSSAHASPAVAGSAFIRF
jgi:hypothetical protein